MGTFTREITPEIAAFMAEQQLFFVGTAAREGSIDVSPKGVVPLHVLSPTRVAWVDYHGSGDDTAKHLREHGRITLMLCSFGAEPGIVRLYGTGQVLSPAQAADLGLPSSELTSRARHVFVVEVEQVQRSCGFGVPRFEVGPLRSQASALQGS